MDFTFDLFGNAYVWLASSARYPHGALVYWRKWANRTRLISWEAADAPLTPGPISEYLAAHGDVGSPRHAEQEDVFQNRYVWLTACPQFPSGALLLWRRWLNVTQVVSWD